MFRGRLEAIGKIRRKERGGLPVSGRALLSEERSRHDWECQGRVASEWAVFVGCYRRPWTFYFKVWDRLPKVIWFRYLRVGWDRDETKKRQMALICSINVTIACIFKNCVFTICMILGIKCNVIFKMLIFSVSQKRRCSTADTDSLGMLFRNLRNVRIFLVLLPDVGLMIGNKSCYKVHRFCAKENMKQGEFSFSVFKKILLHIFL